MINIQQTIEEAMRHAIRAVRNGAEDDIDPLVRSSQNSAFGDYQSNVAFGLAKTLGRKPIEVAREIAETIVLNDLCEPPTVAGGGYINFRLNVAFLERAIKEIAKDPRLGIPRTNHPQKIIIDFSSPTLAKEMHVGHLRSTIIGDAIARILEFFGHETLRLNHVGDWGTQFGMLLQHINETQPARNDRSEPFRISDLEAFYREAKQRFEADPEFAEAARRAVVDLQSGEATARTLWTLFCAESLHHCHEIYQRLNVTLIDRGESFYNAMLPTVVSDLTAAGLAREEHGAICVFLDGWTNREGEPLPIIIRKTDGGYIYATTDLAAIRQRVTIEQADRIIYVTDERQHQHFEMIFAAARKAGWVPDHVSLDHVGFGMVLGADRRPFKTRDGGTIKLKDLLEEAERRVQQSLAADERRQEMSEEQRTQIAKVVGIGAVKYADLSHNLTTDYVFDWDVMLAMDGNTAPYMHYAYARIRSILRKANVDLNTLPPETPIILGHETELALAKELLKFRAVLDLVAETLRPNHLTDYLYALSRTFTAFYDRESGVRVVEAPTQELLHSRLLLCDVTAGTLELGLNLLGIQVLDQM